jgi:hypothetical protein
LAAYPPFLEKDPDKVGPVIVQRMQYWLRDTSFAGVRGPDALAKLPEAERPAWHKLWTDVAQTLAQAQKNAVAEKKPDKK